jgi:hypothetical protein
VSHSSRSPAHGAYFFQSPRESFFVFQLLLHFRGLPLGGGMRIQIKGPQWTASFLSGNLKKTNSYPRSSSQT